MAIFRDKIQSLADEVYDEWQKDENRGKDKWDVLEGFSEAHQIAVVFGNFNRQVENGGIEQWVYNRYFYDDCDKLIEYLEVGAESDERCGAILERLTQLDQYAHEKECNREGYFRERGDDISEDGFICEIIDCREFDKWYYENCGRDDWWETVCGIIEKVTEHEFAPVPEDERPLRVYIENAANPSIGGFTIPLPTSQEELQPFLYGVEITNWQNMAVTEAYSDIKGLSKRLNEAILKDSAPNTLNELNYLAVQYEDLSEFGREVFRANIEAGRNCGSIAEMINLTFAENINCFNVQPVFDAETYGGFLVEIYLQDEHADAFHRLNDSHNPEDRALAAHIDKLEAYVDKGAFGRAAVKEESGVFTDSGYLNGGEGVQQIYSGAHEVPAQYKIYSEPLLMVNDIELTSLLMKVHALGGEYMKYADQNLNTMLVNERSNEFLLLINDGEMHVSRTLSTYYQGTAEHDKWENAVNTPNTRAFALMPVIAGANGVNGTLAEIDFAAQKQDIIDNSILYNRVEAVQKDGIKPLFTLEEWQSLRASEIAGLISWKHLYDADELKTLAAHVDVIHNQRAVETDKIVSIEDFLSNINKNYMECAEYPQADMLRLTREAAAEILARGDADVYRLTQKGAEKLSPLDAVKSNNLCYSNNREFAVKREDIGGLDKWAERKIADIMRQSERGEQKKSKHTEL